MIAWSASRIYDLAKPIVTRGAGLLMSAAVVGTMLLVWANRLVFDYVDGLLMAPGIEVPAGHVVGQTLSWAEFSDAIASRELPGLLAPLLFPLQFGLTRELIGMVAIVSFVSLVAMFGIWWERKVAGRIQSRTGPMRVGGWHGWAQTPADGLKLITKEDLIPADADRILFRLAPYLAFVPALVAFLALPFGTYYVVRDLDVGLIFILAMLGIEVLGVILAGWASNNKWSVYGAMREACQMVSYEIPLGMNLLIPIMCAGALKLTTVGDLQDGGWFTWLAFRTPFTFIASLAYCVAALASCKRAPFDLPESESELVAGFHTEYSGFRWSLFFFAEYAAMFAVSALATILFFGAWYSPLPMSWAPTGTGLGDRFVQGLFFNGPLWFVGKCTFLLYVQIWIRWTLPRIRIDQVLYSCIQVMLPLAMVLLLGNTFWLLLDHPGNSMFASFSKGVSVVLGLIGMAVMFGLVGIVLYGRMNRRRLVGTLARDLLAGS